MPDRSTKSGVGGNRFAAARVHEDSPEYCGALAAWRVGSADPDAASVFEASDTGKVTAVRAEPWRPYDFFWSHHIINSKNQEDSIAPWLLTLAIGGWHLLWPA